MASMSRKFLTGLGLSDAQLESVIEMHTEVTDALKAQIAELKDNNEHAEQLKQELEQAKKASDKASVLKSDYEALKAEYEEYKTNQTRAETRGKKQAAYTELLKSIGINDRRAAAILKVTDLDGMELSADGTLNNAKGLAETARNDWGDFITQTVTVGANTQMSPAQNANATTMTREQILNMKDPAKRQKAIAEHMELFMKG